MYEPTITVPPEVMDELVDMVKFQVDIPLPIAVDFVCRRMGLPIRGDKSFVLDSAFIAVDDGISPEACDVLHAITQEKRLIPDALGDEFLLVYGFDGARMPVDLPRAHTVPPGGYKELHWAPTRLRLAKPEEIAARVSKPRRVFVK